MRLKLRVLVALLAGSLAAVTALSAGPANAAGTAVGPAALPVTGVVNDTGGTFTGAFTPSRFVAENGQVMAVGTLDGTLTDASGNNVGTVSDVPAEFPVTVAQATCTILDLNIGGIALNLLGLMVNLDPIHLNVSAEEGSLLGTLLCLIAGLVGGGGGTPPPPTVVDPLNQLLPMI